MLTQLAPLKAALQKPTPLQQGKLRHMGMYLQVLGGPWREEADWVCGLVLLRLGAPRGRSSVLMALPSGGSRLCSAPSAVPSLPWSPRPAVSRGGAAGPILGALHGWEHRLGQLCSPLSTPSLHRALLPFQAQRFPLLIRAPARRQGGSSASRLNVPRSKSGNRGSGRAAGQQGRAPPLFPEPGGCSGLQQRSAKVSKAPKMRSAEKEAASGRTSGC